MSQPTVYTVAFDGLSLADGNRQAQVLREHLLDASPGVTVELRTEQEGTQDLGSLVEIMLHPELIVAVATALSSFLARDRTVAVEIETPHGTFRAGGLESSDARHIAEMFLQVTDEDG